MEIWEIIEGFENYSVSNLGNVKNSKKRSIICFGITNGYQRVGLYKNKKRTNLYVHRLVAISFIENPESKPEVNHIDGNKLNNNSWNLEWNTSSENSIHSYDIGLSKPINGKENGMSKLSENEVLEIRTKYSSKTISQRELGKLYNVSQCMINNIVNSINWTHI